MDKVRITVQMKQETYQELKQMAEDYGTNMSSLAAQIISQHIKSQKYVIQAVQQPETMIELFKLMNLDVEYQVQCDYGHGYEVVATEETESEAKRVLQEYILNDKKAKSCKYEIVRKK